MNKLVLSRTDMKLVVQLTLSALSLCDLRACVIGSVAAQIHGIEYRDPKDVDLLILNAGADEDGEEIKRRLVKTDSSHFSLTPSRVAGATHRILWCTLAGDCDPDVGHLGERAGSSGRGGRSNARSTTAKRIICKVDILIPSQLYMTHMPELRLYRDSENTFMAYFLDSEDSQPRELDDHEECQVVPISYVPLCTLLMLKLRAWVDHCLPSANEVKHGMIPQDEDDIQEILRVGMEDGKLGNINHHHTMTVEDDMMWVLGGFASWREAEQSVRRFVRKWPQTANGWRAIGFA